MGRAAPVSTEENPAVVFDWAAEKVCRGCALCVLFLLVLCVITLIINAVIRGVAGRRL